VSDVPNLVIPEDAGADIDFGEPETPALTDAELAAIEEGSQAPADPSEPLEVVSIEEFAAVEEEGAAPLVGDAEGAVIPEGGDVMSYGDGGAGKTTLMNDLACHLAAGDDWLGITIARAVRALLIENEGPRPLFREKLRRKLARWQGSPLEGRVDVLEEPWAHFTFAEAADRARLAATIRKREIDVVIVGPLTASGMTEAGTLQDVRAFLSLVAAVREGSGRRVTFIFVHHENKGGQVSGAWEGCGDTLLHVQGQGHGRTRLYFQKARWSSAHHATSLNLFWTEEGEGFTVEDKPELDDDAVAGLILDYVHENPGTGWRKVEGAAQGVGNKKLRTVRDGLLGAWKLVNLKDGVALNRLEDRKPARLYAADDPTVQHLCPTPGTDGAQRVVPLFPEREEPGE
jgi:hypothetical protein